jgi:hypothetical protein
MEYRQLREYYYRTFLDLRRGESHHEIRVVAHDANAACPLALDEAKRQGLAVRYYGSGPALPNAALGSVTCRELTRVSGVPGAWV